MSRVVVTGASGFIGRHLVAALAARGDEVVCLSRRAVAPTGGGRVRDVVADLLEPASYAGEIVGADAVVHLAGLVESRRAEDFRLLNVEATRRLVEACRRMRAPRSRFVLMSSVAAMGPAPRGGLLRETNPCRPLSEYGRSKLGAELVAWERAEELGLVVLRPAFVYGPGDERGLALLPTLVSRAGGGLGPASVRTLSVCHITDVVAAVLLALDRDAALEETLLVSSNEVITWEHLRSVVRTALIAIAPEIAPASILGIAAAPRDTRADAVVSRLVRAAAAGDGQDWGCDTERTRRVLGFTACVPLTVGVRETLRWYRDHGRLAPLFAAAAQEREGS